MAAGIYSPCAALGIFDIAPGLLFFDLALTLTSILPRIEISQKISFKKCLCLCLKIVYITVAFSDLRMLLRSYI